MAKYLISEKTVVFLTALMREKQETGWKEWRDAWQELSTPTPEPDKGLVQIAKEYAGLAWNFYLADNNARVILVDDLPEIASRFAPRDGWVSVSERLPDVGKVKDGQKGWPVIDSAGNQTWTTYHPRNWNDPADSATWVTFWFELPAPPEVK